MGNHHFDEPDLGRAKKVTTILVAGPANPGGGTGTTLTSGLMGHNQSKKRLIRPWFKAPNTNYEFGTTLLRPRQADAPLIRRSIIRRSTVAAGRNASYISGSYFTSKETQCR